MDTVEIVTVHTRVKAASSPDKAPFMGRNPLGFPVGAIYPVAVDIIVRLQNRHDKNNQTTKQV